MGELVRVFVEERVAGLMMSDLPRDEGGARRGEESDLLAALSRSLELFDESCLLEEE